MARAGNLTTLKRVLRAAFWPVALLCLLPWPLAYAYDFAQASADVTVAPPVTVQAVPREEQPAWTVYGSAVGGIPQDAGLFYVDALSFPGDVTVSLYLTNAAELAGSYRYLVMRVGVRRQDGEGIWQPYQGIGADPLPGIFLTLQNGMTSFTLAGYGSYKIYLDGGSYRTAPAAGGGEYSPNFYLSMD